MSVSDDVDTMYVFMVNFDETYPLETVDSLFAEAQSASFKKYDEPRTVAFHVTTEQCSMDDMEDLSSKWSEGDHYDMAVLVVHAHETRLNITEPAFGYNPAYEALRQCSGDRVLVVLGGDTYPLKPGALRSDWSQQRIGRQFEDEYMDGKKGLLLSWNHKYQKSQVDALRAFALPNYICVSNIPGCINDDSKKVHEWKISSLIHDDASKFRGDANSQQQDSDSDNDEPSTSVTETTAEISAPPSGKETGSDNLSDIEEKDSDSSVSTKSHDSGKAKSAESIPFMDTDSDDSGDKHIEAATLPIVRTFSHEERGADDKPNADSERHSSDDETHKHNVDKPPSYEESGTNIYPSVEVAVLAKESSPKSEEETKDPKDEIPAKAPPDVGDESPDENPKADENARENEEDNESTCLFTPIETKEPLPVSDDEVIVEQPSGTDEWKHVSRQYSDSDEACCLCFGGCWSGKDSVTDEDMVI